MIMYQMYIDTYVITYVRMYQKLVLQYSFKIPNALGH